MSSKIAVEDSKFLQKVKRFEQAVFTAVYKLQPVREHDLVRVNYLTGIASILLDFIQIFPFLTHGNSLFLKHLMYST